MEKMKIEKDVICLYYSAADFQIIYVNDSVVLDAPNSPDI